MNLAGGADAASSFFHPLLWQKLGTLIVRGYEGHFETKGDRLVPTDVASYRQALGDLGKIGSEAVLDSVAWINMRQSHVRVQLCRLVQGAAAHNGRRAVRRLLQLQGLQSR